MRIDRGYQRVSPEGYWTVFGVVTKSDMDGRIEFRTRDWRQGWWLYCSHGGAGWSALQLIDEWGPVATLALVCVLTTHAMHLARLHVCRTHPSSIVALELHEDRVTVL